MGGVGDAGSIHHQEIGMTILLYTIHKVLACTSYVSPSARIPSTGARGNSYSNITNGVV